MPKQKNNIKAHIFEIWCAEDGIPHYFGSIQIHHSCGESVRIIDEVPNDCGLDTLGLEFLAIS